MTLRLTLLAWVTTVASNQVPQLAAQAAAATPTTTSAQQSPKKAHIALAPASVTSATQVSSTGTESGTGHL